MPVRAVIRRVPAETDSSPITLNRPTCPTLSRCVPPQSSREKSPIETTRTISGYFSPKRAIAPSDFASAIGIVVQETGSPFRTRWLTVCSIGLEPVAADGLGVGEVEPEPVGLDLAAGLLGVLAQMDMKGVVQDVRRRVRPADRLATLGVDLGPDGGVERRRSPRSPCRRGA